MKTIKAKLNNEIIPLNLIDNKQVKKIPVSQRTKYNDNWYFNPNNAVLTPNVDCLAPSEYHVLKSNYEDFSGESQWRLATTINTKLKIIEKISPYIDKETAIELSNGLTFEGTIFPLIGDAYAYNMTGATAYVIGQSSGGRDLLDITGNYVHVKSISGLVSLGDSTVTSIVKSAVDEKIALQSKTTSQLIEILASYE